MIASYQRHGIAMRLQPQQMVIVPVYRFMAAMAQERYAEVVRLDSHAFAVPLPVAVRRYDSAVILAAVLAWVLSGEIEQRFVAVIAHAVTSSRVSMVSFSGRGSIFLSRYDWQDSPFPETAIC
jgi:hypothetical protein